jgi:cytochrome c oxidase cbb3-type subunit 3
MIERQNGSGDRLDRDRVIHSVDGIEEYDNRLPRWWLYSFYAAIGFAAIYWWVYHVAGVAELPRAAYQAEADREALARAESAGEDAAMSAEALVALSHHGSVVEQGKQVFASTCAPCHRADAGGNVGPNLTDEFWLHGGAPDRIWKTVTQGVPDKGMPSWRPQIGAEKVQAVTAYLLTLRNTNVPGGKAPQGARETLSLTP